jgi:hypothetical protein
MAVPPASPRRPITVPMMIIGFVAGVVTVILVLRYFF